MQKLIYAPEKVGAIKLKLAQAYLINLITSQYITSYSNGTINLSSFCINSVKRGSLQRDPASSKPLHEGFHLDKLCVICM